MDVAEVFIQPTGIAAGAPGRRWVRRMCWGFVVALASCEPTFQTGLVPHAMAADIDPAWLPDIRMTGQSYVEQACNPRPTQDATQPCPGAMAPRANEAVDCPATFTFQGIVGCCLPYHAATSPDVTDRVFFFECPGRDR